MAAVLPPVPRSKPEWGWPYLVLLLVVFVLLWKLAPVRILGLLDRLSPFHVGTPRISGTVVNALTGRPVPGMGVWLLCSHVTPRIGVPSPPPEGRRSVVTQTDSSRTFYFARGSAQAGWVRQWSAIEIAIT